MKQLKKYLKDANKEPLEAIEQYLSDYPMGENLTGFEFDLAKSQIKDKNFITTKNGYKAGFIKGSFFIYFVYYNEIPLDSITEKDFSMHKCNHVLRVINVQEFADRILLYLNNKDDSIPKRDLETLICNYLILVHGSVENYQNKKKEMMKWYEKKTGRKSSERSKDYQ